jgi:uncharacterized membrane protein
MDKKTFKKFIDPGNEHLQKLHDIVTNAIEEEKLLSHKILEFEEKNLPFGRRLSDFITGFGGSWKFIIFLAAFLILWAALNVYFLLKPFDPFPFIFLNLMLSTLAAVQAPIILMSQNRKEEKDRKRAINDYLINLKAEIEIRNLHEKLDLLITEQMKSLFEIQKEQINAIETIRESLKKVSGTHMGQDKIQLQEFDGLNELATQNHHKKSKKDLGQ